MMQIAQQFKRIFADHGGGDKDFADQEAKLREAQRNLLDATEALRRASEILTDVVTAKTLQS